MSVWLTIPSKRPPEEAEKTLNLWLERGYNIALWIDSSDGTCYDFAYPQIEQTVSMVDLSSGSRLVIVMGEPTYPGYACAVNALVRQVIQLDSTAEWFIAAGDDVEPDPNHSAEEIAKQCNQHFWEVALGTGGWNSPEVDYPCQWTSDRQTFGVMQPTGDPWGDKDGPYIQRVAGSAWIGREFARRMYQGLGPLWPEYFHMGVDEELQAVAEKMGVFWQRPDLTHHHQHWGRPLPGEKMAPNSRMPAFLKRANSIEEWDRYKKLFAERRAAGFPGSEPL